MKCIIVDDDVLSRNILKQLIKQVDYLELIGEFASPVTALNFIEKEKADLMFLDMEMPEMSGMDMLKTAHLPMTIIISAYPKYALDAFEFNVIDYLLKPITLPRFIKAVEKAKKNSDTSVLEASDYFFIKSNSAFTKVPYKNILWIEALGDYVTLQTTAKKFVLHFTLRVIETKLPHNRFIRVHRSYIVNVDNIDTIDDSLIIINKKVIPIGVSYKDKVIHQLNLL